MANSHILEQTAPGRFRVVYHVAIPATNNAAGVSWRTIMAARVAASVAAGNNASALPDGDGTAGTIAPAEKTLITTGAVVEVIREEKGQSLAAFAGVFSQRSAEIHGELQARYQQFGRTV